MDRTAKTAKHQAPAARIYQRLDEAVIVPFEDCSSADFSPSPTDCHHNVNRWVEANPNHRAVRGWLSFGPVLQVLRFNAHSVVCDENRTLFDLTPSDASQQHPFIPYEGMEEDFAELVKKEKLVYVEHIVPAGGLR